MHTVFALLCFVVVIHWLIFPYPSGLLHWHCGNLTIAPVPAKQPWWIWINTSCEFIINDCITTTKQSTTKLCAYFLGYTVDDWRHITFLPWGRTPSTCTMPVSRNTKTKISLNAYLLEIHLQLKSVMTGFWKRQFIHIWLYIGQRIWQIYFMRMTFFNFMLMRTRLLA